jgi:hypothetical protein
VERGGRNMTSEKFILELLIEAESLGIRTKVLNLSKKIRESEPRMDINTSIEIAYNTIKNESNR